MRKFSSVSRVTAARRGVVLNELTGYRWHDPVVGTPGHLHLSRQG